MRRTRIPGRYVFVGGTFLISLFMYIDRACISTAKEPITADLGMSDAQMGWVLSALAALPCSCPRSWAWDTTPWTKYWWVRYLCN